MADNTAPITVEGDLEHETDLAYLVYSHLTGVAAWVPKSLCEYDGDEEFTMSYNTAMEKGLI